MDKTELKKILNDVKSNVSKLLKGKDDILEKAICTFFSGGHLLLEDVPGTGKTTLAKALAKSVDMNFNRIQFTPDLMPADITGVSIFNQNKGVFEFRKGPVFSNIVLADEINRASPRTQSALLEAMGEGQVSTDSGQFILEKPFFVIATQNNVESKGTYTLPESQMDRFTMKLSLGYVSINEEIQILDGLGFIRQLDELKPVVDSKKVVEAMNTIENIKVSDELKHFIVTVVNHTRNAQGVKLGASPRASLNLMKVAQAAAAFDGRDFVIPDDILSNAVNVLAHRLILDSSGYITGISRENAIISILEKIKVPG
ncbi:MAG TPA: MoxR family ATPase [bacterium]|nr:MoxR family ATPase [bacterium]